jgi:outer membrane protein assembly factor BamE (lipoprotein component of BamABCDE complex)
MNRPERTATAAALFLACAQALATTSAAAAIEPPKFSIHVERSRVNDELIQKIQPGQTQEDVANLVGSPQRTTRFPRSHTLAWDYDYRDTWGYEAVFSVIFDDSGTVQSKTNVRRRS